MTESSHTNRTNWLVWGACRVRSEAVPSSGRASTERGGSLSSGDGAFVTRRRAGRVPLKTVIVELGMHSIVIRMHFWTGTIKMKKCNVVTIMAYHTMRLGALKIIQ